MAALRRHGHAVVPPILPFNGPTYRLKGVFAKNERGYRFAAKNKRF